MRMMLPSPLDLPVSWYNNFTLRMAHSSWKKEYFLRGPRSDERHPLLATRDYHRSVVERLCQALDMRRGVIISPHEGCRCTAQSTRAFPFGAMKFCPLMPLRRSTIAPTLLWDYLTLVHVNLLMPPKP